MESLKVLVADDEPLIRDACTRVLKKMGFVTFSASTGTQAVDVAREQNIGLAVLDIKMPGKDGIELITQIMGQRKDIPIIINTAYQSHKGDFMTWAADAYVVKSSSLKELKAKIKELLKK